MSERIPQEVEPDSRYAIRMVERFGDVRLNENRIGYWFDKRVRPKVFPAVIESWQVWSGHFGLPVRRQVQPYCVRSRITDVPLNRAGKAHRRDSILNQRNWVRYYQISRSVERRLPSMFHDAQALQVMLGGIHSMFYISVSPDLNCGTGRHFRQQTEKR